MKDFAGTFRSFSISDSVKNRKWIVDSGATNHIVHNKELLEKMKTKCTKNTAKVYLPDGKTLDNACTWECKISENDTIKNVSYITGFKYNLLSVSKLTSDLKYFISFYPDF